MNAFFLTTAIIPRICFVILFAVAVAYLLSLKHKSAATWWLIAFCVGLALVDIGWDLPFAVPLTQMEPGVYHLVFLLGQGLFIPLGLAYVQFAYAFRGNPYPREARMLAWILGVLAVGVLLLILFTPAYVFSPLLAWNQVGALLSMLLLSLWAAIVFLRKTLRFSSDARALQAAPEDNDTASAWTHLRKPYGRAARACRTFCGISLLFLLFTVGGGLAWALGIFEAFGEFLFIAGYILFLYGMLVAYVNYAPEPTTVQVKLVGAALVTTLLIFVLLALTLFGEERMLAASGVASPPPHTLRFDPDVTGGYTVTAQPLQLDPVLGDTLGLTNDTVREVTLPFDFPFYGQTWKTLYVSDNSRVSMGPPADIDQVLTLWASFHTHPFIAPLGIDLDPTQGGGVFYKATPEAVTLTWHEVPFHKDTHRHTAQLVLYPTGAIAMHYAAPGSGPVASELWQLGLRGLHPGGVNVPRQVLPREPVEVLRSAAGVALLEDYATQVYAYQEAQGVPLFWFVISTALFILFVFPYLFRYSLLKPLDRLLAGVRRVEAGQTDTVVGVEVEDEIGLLTQHFNGMTHAVHEAETKLHAYAETLEDKVEARTAELARSLEELKAAQAQLVQQEKMAS
ncbi:MAG TPA: HAMP domain-containing protein, partial [Rhodothermales bacterium]|nr:HAMP domain-containing protein [Rhodothermales bacterium]